MGNFVVQERLPRSVAVSQTTNANPLSDDRKRYPKCTFAMHSFINSYIYIIQHNIYRLVELFDQYFVKVTNIYMKPYKSLTSL